MSNLRESFNAAKSAYLNASEAYTRGHGSRKNLFLAASEYNKATAELVLDQLGASEAKQAAHDYLMGLSRLHGEKAEQLTR